MAALVSSQAHPASSTWQQVGERPVCATHPLSVVLPPCCRRACVTGCTISKIGTPDRLQGLQALREDDQAAVRQRFGGGAGGKAPRKTGVHTLF